MHNVIRLIAPSPGGFPAVRASVVLLHGLGDSGEGWTGGAQMLASLLPFGVEIVLPTAATIPVTLNGGMPMPAWYDLKGLGSSRDMETCDGIDDSAAIVDGLIKWSAKPRAAPRDGHELCDVDESRGSDNDSGDTSTAALPVVLAGFSQGGALSLYTGLRTPSLAGIICMSGYLPRPGDFTNFPKSGAKRPPPVRMFHGKADEMVRHEWGLQTEAKLRELGVRDLTLTSYDTLGHSVDMEELNDVAKAIEGMLQLGDLEEEMEEGDGEDEGADEVWQDGTKL